MKAILPRDKIIEETGVVTDTVTGELLLDIVNIRSL